MTPAARRALALASLLGSTACGPMFWDGCIARGTRVRTRRGDRAIEDFEVGDDLLCCDPATGALFDTTVTHVKRAHRECVRLAGEGFELVATSNHPLFDPVAREWAPAGDWALGQRGALLHVAKETATPVQVTRREVFHAVRDVFDLTVEHALHTFVANGIAVHNKPPPVTTCRQLDGGTVRQHAPCTCANGGTGTTWCATPGGLPECVECSDPDAGP